VDGLTQQDDSLSIPRSNQQPKNHGQAIAHYNKLMTKLNMLNSLAISHPIHRLPLELLEHIFHMLLELESEDETSASPSHEPFPLNLTQVCVEWESLVMAVRNRRLWSTVRIDPADLDWLGRLHVHLYMSRGEDLNIHVTEMTQSVVDELARHHQRIRSFPPGSAISQIWESTTSEPDTIQVVITNQSGKKPFSIPLSTSMTALPFVYLGEGSLHRLQSFSKLRVLHTRVKPLQLHELGGPLQLPALQTLLLLVAHENPLEFLKVFAPSQLLDLQLELPKPLSPSAYHELETFIIQHMPNLRYVVLVVSDYIDSEFVQPVEEEEKEAGSTTQSSAAKQSESLRRIDFRTGSKRKIPPFERLIASAPHLEECHLLTPIKSLPCFSQHLLVLEFNFYDSPISHVMNGELFILVHLEVFKLTFSAAEQLQLLTLFLAPSLLSLEVLYVYESDLQSYSIPVDALLEFISTSQGIRDMELGFPVDDSMHLSLPELQNLKVTYISNIFVLASFGVPKLQHLFLEIDDGRGEDESIAGGEDVAEDTTSIAPPPSSFEAIGSSGVPDMDNTRQPLEMGNEAQKRSIPEEDKNVADMDRFKDTDLHEAPSVTSPPAFPALTFEHLKDFEFEVSTVSSYPIRVLPYFPDMLTALPALERITLPAVSFDAPYIDHLVQRISEIPTLCSNLQVIRTRDYPTEWSNLLKFLRDRKRASILSNPTLRPIRSLHFPITPHGSIVEQLQDAMLGKVSFKSFPALFPWPLLIDSTLMLAESFQREDTTVDSDEDEETRSQVQDGDERTAKETRVQAQEEEDTAGNSDKAKQKARR
jgi:hypothetical protein